VLRNYFKTTFRYFWKNKIFSSINIIGLSIGICVCFFALLYVQFELNRDSYNTKADRIYRLVTDVKTPTGISYESTSAPMAPAMKSIFPEIKEIARVFMDDMIIQSNPDNARKEEIAYADSSVFKIFTWPLLRGNQKHLFDAPYNVVMSESAAKRYFGSADPLGQTLTINGKDKATVTGIMKDIPYDSHLRVDMLFSISTLVNSDWDHNWTRFGFYTYLLLNPGQDINRFEKRLPAFIHANIGQDQVKYQLALEPLRKVYLYGKPRGHRTGASASGSITNVYIVSVVAALVLFIACFNFINLTTAFSLQRAKEIGVRKVIGATKKQLVMQFFIDAISLCLISLIVALLLILLLLPLFNQIAGIIINTNIFENLKNLLLLFTITIIVGVLSGTYPALVLAGFNPVTSLKGKFESSANGLMLRKTLIVGQFSISIFLIIATIVVFQQLDFMQNQQLGFQKDHKLVIDYQFDSRINQHTDAIKQQLRSVAGVNIVNMSSSIPGTPNNQYKTFIENNRGEKQEQRTDTYFIDDDFVSQYRVKIVAGRGFSKNMASDTLHSMLVNETMVKTLGFSSPQEAIGKQFLQLHQKGTIIGVVKDFRFHSSIEKTQPLILRADPGSFTLLTLDMPSENVRSTVDKIETAWKTIAPGLPLVYFFADEAYNQQYIAQQRFGKIFICFAIIAIAISCLGLLGLSAFSTIQRRSEIGIRKVLGASVSNITFMLSKDFVKLIIIALLITAPSSWWIMNNWLQGFAYHINISLWVFIFSGFMAISIALFTISFQAVKAAMVKPVKSLRNG
jgi:putative ABC transport system permease protein